MKKYFYAHGSQSFGPYDIVELQQQNINKETLIWFQELGNWTPAGNIRELNELFIAIPPPIIVNQPPVINQNNNTPPPLNKIENQQVPLYNERVNVNSSASNNTQFEAKPKTWLAEAIIVTILFLSPLGAIGIYKASQVHSRYLAGDYAGAKVSSNQARNLTLITLVLGIFYMVYIFS